MSVDASVVSNDIWGSQKTFYNDFFVEKDITVAPTDLYLAQSMFVQNSGLIRTNIHVCDRCEVYVQNSGVIDSNFILGQDVNLYQVVFGQQDLNDIGTTEPYTVLVDSDDVLTLSDLISVSGDAKRVFIENTKINIDSVPDNRSVLVDIGDNVIFLIDDATDFQNDVLLDNVSGGWSVRFEENNSDPMFSVAGQIDNGRLSIKRVRETDYAVVFDGADCGDFLNNLRIYGGGEKLFLYLDNAMDMNELNNIMSRSVRFNSDVLLQPVQTLYAFDMLKYDFLVGGSGADLFGVMSEDFLMYGLNLKYVNNISDDFLVGVGARFGKIEYGSDLDDFGGLMYGLDLNLKYKFYDNAFVRTDIMAAKSDFDVNMVFYNNKIISEPSVLSGYVLTDFGYKFDLSDSFYLTPYLGVVADYYKLSTVSDFNMYMRLGTDFGYTFEFLGVRYNYDARISVNDFSDVMLSAHVGAWSDIDALGGDITLSAVSISDTISYALSINLRLMF